MDQLFLLRGTGFFETSSGRRPLATLGKTVAAAKYILKCLFCHFPLCHVKSLSYYFFYSVAFHY